jgi:3-deoxy-manno-octulosonate cytidylyltransferase (CMP-KDO synthetase)
LSACIAVIPARFASTRFPGKPLAQMQGRPIIRHVYERVLDSGLFDDVIVATDDTRIAEAVEAFGGRYKLTSPHHPSGSDRIAEVIRALDCEVVFNIQGDEPMIEPSALAELKAVFSNPEVRVATLFTPLTDPQALLNINVVKVVFDNALNALYFSRSAIPANRDGIPDVAYFRHIGVYAYRKQTLLDFVNLPQGKLEQAEKLEQLRFLEHGIPIRLVETSYQGIGIDTPEDLLQMEKLLSGKA